VAITLYCEKKSFRHCERSAAVHFLDCHVALQAPRNDEYMSSTDLIRGSSLKKDCRVKPDNDNNTTYCKKKSFRHCERSVAVHFLDCHVALQAPRNDKKFLILNLHILVQNLRLDGHKLDK